MKSKILVIFLTSICYCAIAFAENIERLPLPKHAQSLDQLPSLFRSKRGLTNFNEEIRGVPRVDRLGTNLPVGLNRKDIARLIAPNEDISLAIAVGAKAFPYRLNSYIAIACFARNKKDMPDYNGSCRNTYYGDKVVYLGLIEYDSLNLQLKLVASSVKPVKVETNLSFSNQNQSSKKPLLLEDYLEFDFAPFRISKIQTAFGLRLAWSESYAGGNGYFESLALFIVDKDRIINILSEPIYYYRNIAGVWNKDRSRQHDLYEGENVLVVLPSQTNGYYDIQIKSLDTKWQKIIKWNNSQKRYLPIPSK